MNIDALFIKEWMETCSRRRDMDRRKRIVKCYLLLAASIFISSETVSATSVESQSSVGFTGVYVPSSAPDPPPINLAKTNPVPSQSRRYLPQTNAKNDHWLMGLGMLLVAFVGRSWFSRKIRIKN